MQPIRCPFCHEMIDSGEFRDHIAEHQKIRADGQQSEYVTLPPEERAEGDLTDVPKVYLHTACGGMTKMPDEIIRSYLVNPYLYRADETFCCGCNHHVPLRECIWVETGEDLQTYTDQLRAAKPEMRPKGCLGLILLIASGAIFFS